jgi:molecular chaperone DnaJ
VFPEQLSTDQQILLDQLCATTSGAGGAADGRLQAWQRSLRAWERGLRS